MNPGEPYKVRSTTAFDFYSIFHILAIKTDYHQLENFKRIEKKIENKSINPIIGFDCKNMK